MKDGSDKKVEQVPIPDSIGGHEILDRIGQGGMGVVYRAYQPSLEREVAIKVISPDLVRTKERRQRFEVEGKALAKLRHSSIVIVHDSGFEEDLAFIVMEYVDGLNLYQLLQSIPLSDVRIASYIRDVADAVSHAHAMKIFHRDIKPSNVLIDKEDRALITDFGLAKIGDAGSGTLDNAVLGSPHYIAPEIAQGGFKEAGVSSDIYSIGAVLFECLALKPRPSSYSGIVKPSQIRPGVNKELEKLCLKCMEPRLQDRYEFASELVAELDRFLKPKNLELQSPTMHRRKLGVWIGCSLATAVAAGFAGATFFRKEQQVLRIATGLERGMYSDFGKKLKNVLQLSVENPIEVLNTQGSLDNVKKLASGDAEFAIAEACCISPNDTSIVLPLYNEVVHVLVRKSAKDRYGEEIKYFSQIEGLRIALGPRGSGMRKTALSLLNFYNLRERDFKNNMVPFTQLSFDKALDGAIVTTGLDNKSLKELLKEPNFRLVGLDPDWVDSQSEVFHAFYLTADKYPKAFGNPHLEPLFSIEASRRHQAKLDEKIISSPIRAGFERFGIKLSMKHDVEKHVEDSERLGWTIVDDRGVRFYVKPNFAGNALSVKRDVGVSTVATTAFLVTRPDTDPKLVAKVVDTIYQANLLDSVPGMITEEEARAWRALPWHPAAYKFLQIN